MTEPTLVVLAAGQARRYGGVKPLAPVGLAGEAILDLLASDALASGFGRIVLVIAPGTGPAIRYHVRRAWPSSVDVHFAVQESPRGTVDAVLAAAPWVTEGAPFGVANADDLYGEEGFSTLAASLSEDEHVLVSYRLRSSIVASAPVTRGICELGPDGLLRRLHERRQVKERDGRFVAGDGGEPTEIPADAPVSVNLWGFHNGIWAVLEEAMAARDGDGPGAASAAGDAGAKKEVLLPDVVDQLVARGGSSVRVAPCLGPCIGVTHPADLPLVQAKLAIEVGEGRRPAQPWTAVSRPHPTEPQSTTGPAHPRHSPGPA